MAKKDKALYAPGELSRVRDRLGDLDREEAKQLAEKLGGQVGYERNEDEEKARQGPPRRTRQDRVEVKIGSRPKRRVDLAPDAEYAEGSDKKKHSRRKELNPLDDPTISLRPSYWDRIKMDRFAGQSEFEIKSMGQVFHSIISIFSDIPDYVSHIFVNRRMTEYYKKVEVLVVSTRNLFPRNNIGRNERTRKSAPTVYLILDTIRQWDIEKISGDLARIQSHPRNVRVSDFSEILRAIYKPLFILDQMDSDAHIRGAFKILYKLLYIENPIDAQSKYQELIRSALAAFFVVRRDVHYLLYPLLMKAVSSKFVPYHNFFDERRNRIMSFLNVSEENQIVPVEMTMQEDAADLKPGSEDAQANEEKKDSIEEKELSEEEKARRAAEEAERKVLERGLRTLEMLFPKAGWDRLATYPDLYPYFVDVFDLKKGLVNIAPTDPMQQIFILMRTLEELFFGLRYVSFGSVTGSSGNIERVDTILMELINNWHYYIELSFEKEYLPRMAEYIRILEGSIEERSSPYTKKLITEMHWLKRFFYLPFHKFDSLVPPTVQKKDTTPIYAKIKTLRKYLSAVAAGIEHGNKAGGAEAKAHCEGIDNPWETYMFQVPNPLSMRLEALLAPKQKNNATLIYFCLAITAVLDKLVNSEDSWAYSIRPGPLFRSVNGEGLTPLTGIDERIDADALFKKTLRERQRKAEG